jgi:fatty acid desaturase
MTRRKKQATELSKTPRRRSTGATPVVRAALGPLATCAEMKALTEPSTLGAFRDIGFDLTCIAGAVILVLVTKSVFLIPLAALYIGFMQRRLSNLLHELSHAKLFRTPTANKVAGFVIATFMLISFCGYHDEHNQHHAFLGSEADPKLQSYRKRQATSMRRDKTDFIFCVFMPNAFLFLPIATLVGWIRFPGSRLERLVRVLFWAGLVTGFVALGDSVLFAVLWVLPLLFIRPAVNMVTDQINHLGLIEDGNIFQQTRGFTANWLVLHLFAGHHDDAWHPVHHLMWRIQHRHLADAYALIRARRPDLAARIPWCSGLIWRRRNTPGTPSALEHIVALLKAPEVELEAA